MNPSEALFRTRGAVPRHFHQLMYDCKQCSDQFETFQAKANHVRWHHKEHAYSPEGLQRIKETPRRTADKIYGPKIPVTKERTCKCGIVFIVTYVSNRRYQGRKTCSSVCAQSRTVTFTPEIRQKQSLGVKRWIKNHPDEHAKNQERSSNSLKNSRFSSKAERELADRLCPLGFDRGRVVRTELLNFAVDLMSEDKKIWIESDGEWHFRQVHKGHDFVATQLRDSSEEKEAVLRGVLLIRINNQTTSIEEQVAFIHDAIQNWDNTGKVIRFGM